MPRASHINPSLPVWAKSDFIGRPFDIIRVGHFTSPRFGPTWRLTIVSDGEEGLLLMGANEVRDDEFGAFQRTLETNPRDPIGPCTFAVTPHAQKGFSARFDIIDYGPDATDEPRDGTAAFAAPKGKTKD